MNWPLKWILLFSYLILAACATQTGLREELDRSVKAYNRMLRWHELENAGTTYVETELQDEYLKKVSSLKKRGLSFTDFRINSIRYIPETKTGDVITEFEYYILPSNRVKTLSYHQEWIYLESLKSWKVKSGLPVFE
ncbi:MAG: hypothetical protein WCI45_01965 [Desulfuromonadales bacterium]